MSDVAKLEEMVRLQEGLIEGLKKSQKGYEELIEAKDAHQASSERVIENQRALIQGLESEVRKADELIAVQKEKLEALEANILAIEQTGLYDQALMQTADYYAVESRSLLVYVLERSEKSRDFLRLWEVLPQDQKDVYNQESATWLGKQPPHVDPELRAKLKPAPSQNDL